MAIIFQVLSILGFILFLIPFYIVMFLDSVGNWLDAAIFPVAIGVVLLALLAVFWGGSVQIADKLTNSKNSIIRIIGYLAAILVSLPVVSLVLAILILVGSIITSPLAAVGWLIWTEYPAILWGALILLIIIAVSLFFSENPKQDETSIALGRNSDKI